MANIVKCPECRKTLKLSDEAAGKRVRCPGCKQSFVAPAPDEPEEEVEEAVSAEEPPLRRPRCGRDEDEEDDRPRRRKGRPRDIAAPMLPMVYGVLSCLFSCAMPVGFALGALALAKANQAMNDLPDSRRAEAAERSLRIAKILGVIGMCLSTVLLVVAVVLNIVSPVRH